MAKHKRPSWHDEKRAQLIEALLPTTQRALTKNEAYTLVYIAASSMRQGLSIDVLIPRLLDELYGGDDVPVITDEFRERAKVRAQKAVDEQEAFFIAERIRVQEMNIATKQLETMW